MYILNSNQSDKFNYEYQYKETSEQYQALAIRYTPTFIDDKTVLASFTDFEIRFDKTTNEIHFYEHTFFKQHFLVDAKKRYIQKIGDFLASNIIGTMKDSTLQMKINLYPYFKSNKLYVLQKYFQNKEEDLELFLIDDDVSGFKDLRSYIEHLANNRDEKSIQKTIYKSFKDSITCTRASNLATLRINTWPCRASILGQLAHRLFGRLSECDARLSLS